MLVTYRFERVRSENPWFKRLPLIRFDSTNTISPTDITQQ